MSRGLTYCFFITSLIFLYGCAQRVNLTGGEMDKTPPLIIKSYPQNFSTHFNDREVLLYFDEYVQVKNAQTQLIVSPPFTKKPDVTVNGKNVKVRWKDTLKVNTTYVFNFGNAIQDITENNPLDSNVFVFSTGDQIDSLSVKGSIKDAFSKEQQPETWVILYEASKFNDSLLYTQTPDYFAKTSANGTFSIDYLKGGSYYLYALQESNNNYKFDNPKEKIAFKPDPIQVPDSQVHELLLFMEAQQNRLLLLSSKATAYGRLNVSFTDEVKKLSIQNIHDSLYYINQQKDVDSLQIILLDTQFIRSLDSSYLYLAFDSIQDTIFLKSFSRYTPKPVKISKKTASYRLIDTVHLVMNNPIKSINMDSVVLFKDTLIDSVFIYPENKHPDKLILSFNKEEAVSYKLTFFPGAIWSYYGMRNTDTITYSFTFDDAKKYADLTFILKNDDIKSQKLVSLLGTNDKVIEYTKLQPGDSTFTFEQLLQGEYSVRMVYDENENGIWDSGILRKQIQPEPVIYYPELIKVEGGFDMENTWILNSKKD